MNKIGGSARVREELTQALVEGRGVTAKVRWVSKSDEEGRNRWIHCTPLLGSNAQVGVWMVVIVDDEKESMRRWRQAPPVVLPPRGTNAPAAAEARKDPSLQTEIIPPPKSPGRVRTYNHPVSLNSNISLDLELDVDLDSPPPASPSHNRDHSPFSLT